MGTDLLPFSEVAALVAAATMLGILLLAPLYLSQRRDVRRLREWMERQPGYARADLAASEARLDRAEQELERIYAERGEPLPTAAASQATEVHPGGIAAAGDSGAAGATSERPALERITMERAALVPHPRWRRFVGRITQPRWLALIGLVALAIGAVAIVASERLLEGDDSPAGAPLDPSGIEVAVLNATSVGGLAGEISRTIEASGFLPGDVANFEGEEARTVVMFQPGHRDAARRVARELRGSPAIVPIEPAVARASGAADVVAIVGEDQVR